MQHELIRKKHCANWKKPNWRVRSMLFSLYDVIEQAKPLMANEAITMFPWEQRV